MIKTRRSDDSDNMSAVTYHPRFKNIFDIYFFILIDIERLSIDVSKCWIYISMIIYWETKFINFVYNNKIS